VPSHPLPIYGLQPRIIESLEPLPRLFLQAPTGSGKSTQVAQILLNHGLAPNGQIIVLQPRRLPTRILAARVRCSTGHKLDRRHQSGEVPGPKALPGFWEFDLVTGDELVVGCQSCFAGRSQVHFMDYRRSY
jgi:hypothetical protein